MLRARAPHFSALFMGLGSIALSFYAWPFHIDDALITARYAHRLISGQGYTFNDSEPSDGVTGPLWLLPMMLGEWTSRAALAWAKAVSCASMLSATVWLVWQVRRRQLGGPAAWATALICLASMPIAVWSVAGLETGAATLLLVAITQLASRPAFSGMALGTCVAIAIMLRPEMLAGGLCAIACLALSSPRSALRALMVVMIGALSLCAFRLSLFGAVLPLSIAAKPAELVHGLGYLRSLLMRTDTLCFAVLIFVAAKHGRTSDRIALAIGVTHVLACTLAGGDWMPGRRLFVPALPLFAALSGVGFAHLCLRRSRWFVVVLGVGLLFSTLELVRELPAARAAGKEASRNLADIVQVLRKHEGPIVALDVGAIGYALKEAPILDLGGLTSPAIAHRPGGHLDKRVQASWLEARAPVWIVLHSSVLPRVASDGGLLALRGYPVEQHVAALPYVRESFAVDRVLQIAPRYFYVFLLRRELSGQPRE